MIRRGLVCDECLVEAEGPDGVILARTAADARQQAKRAGWRITPQGRLLPRLRGATGLNAVSG